MLIPLEIALYGAHMHTLGVQASEKALLQRKRPIAAIFKRRPGSPRKDMRTLRKQWRQTNGARMNQSLYARLDGGEDVEALSTIATHLQAISKHGYAEHQPSRFHSEKYLLAMCQHHAKQAQYYEQMMKQCRGASK